MLANGIKQTTTTTGTGSNLALAAVTGYPKLSDALPLNFPFKYTALTAAGLFIEEGIGYLSDANTMVRSRINATFVGGVYNSANPTPANLTGTTTIDCSPGAASLESMLPTVDGVSASVSRYLTSAGRACINSPSSLLSLRVYYVPFLLRTAAQVAALAISVTTAGAASTVARAALYTCNERGYMGSLLASTSDLDTSTTGNKAAALTTPLFLPPGWYFTALVASGTPTINGYTSNAANIIGGSPLGYSTGTPPVAIDFRSEAVATAVMPATASTNTSASNIGVMHTPLVYLGVS